MGMKTMVGTAFYVAPEVLDGNYDYRCDNWSLGVITYILLCGNPPFYGENTKDVFAKVKKGKFSFSGGIWKKTSKFAKDFIAKLLCVDLKKRMNAEEALSHVWLNMSLKEKDCEKIVTPNIVKKLIGFRKAGKLKKEAMKIIVNLMSENEIKLLKETFQSIDKENKGKITLKELKKVLADLGYLYDADESCGKGESCRKGEICGKGESCRKAEICGKGESCGKDDICEICGKGESCGKDDICEICRKGEICGKGESEEFEVNYSEFLAANLGKKDYLNKDRIYQAFKHFDVDDSETINVRNLKESMAREGRKLSEHELALWIEECEKKSCGKIDFEEFYSMMKNEKKESICMENCGENEENEKNEKNGKFAENAENEEEFFRNRNMGGGSKSQLKTVDE